MLSWFALAAAVTIDDGVIEVSADTPWPKSITEGFWPIYVEVRNISSKPQLVDLNVATSGISGARNHTPVELAPRESQKFEMAVPGWYDSTVASAEVLRAGATPLRTPPIGPRNKYDTCIAVTNLVFETDCTLVSPEKLPTNYINYTSLNYVILDMRGSWATNRLEPLAAWVRQGGWLVVIDPDQNLKQQPAFSGWIQERFQFTERFQMGLGYLWIYPDSVVATAYATLVTASSRPESYAENLLPFSVLTIPGLGKAPTGAFALLLMATLAALGPLNYYLVRRLKRPESWLVTTPLISLAATALVGTYGAMQGGFQIFATSRAIGFLDQRLHTLEILEARSTWSGASPPAYLEVPEGTWHFPIGAGDDNRYSLDLGGTRKLEGGFMGVRLVESHKIIHSLSMRGRVAIEGERITNQLGYNIKELFYRTKDDTWYTVRNLQDGANASLNGTSGTAIFDQAPDEWPGINELSKVPLGGYAAYMETPSFVPQDNIGLVYKAGTTVLIGVLEE